MSVGFELPSHDALLAEQASVQAGKFQGRLLAGYNSCIFPGQNWHKPRGSAVVDFVRPFIGDDEHVTLEGVLEGLSKAKAGEPVNWVDMGGGRALAMRQLGSMPDSEHRFKMTNVDLFNFGLDGLEPDELEYLEDLAPGMTELKAEPELITTNVETVKLPEPADIITSIEAIQYLNNPLGALANWYNQLTDNGLMVVATQHDWASWIRYSRGPDGNERGEMPAKHLLEELSASGIDFAATDVSDLPNGDRPILDLSYTRIMAIRKRPGTELRVTRPVTEIWVNEDKYKVVYYDIPTADSPPLIEVVKTDTPVALGAVVLDNAI